MKRKHKLYSRPKKPYDKKRIEEEAIIIERFGLKNKREICKILKPHKGDITTLKQIDFL